MASRSYVPRHSAAPVRSGPGARRTVAVLATSVGAAAASTALANPAGASTPAGVWNRVANCESSQRWHIDTGNGYYGGLQFSSGTWAANGGHRYARRADEASRSEQIEVARRVLASQGRNAWPVCGPRAGLTKSSGHATAARLPAVAGTQTAAQHRTKRRGTSRHATSPHGRTAPARTHHLKSRRTHRGGYVVRAGDTLSGIARAEHVAGGWHALYRANRHTLHHGPDLLQIGQRLALP